MNSGSIIGTLLPFVMAGVVGFWLWCFLDCLFPTKVQHNNRMGTMDVNYFAFECSRGSSLFYQNKNQVLKGKKPSVVETASTEQPK